MTMRDNEPTATTAADGGHVPGACNTLAEFIRTLEDGQFDADCYGALQERTGLPLFFGQPEA